MQQLPAVISMLVDHLLYAQFMVCPIQKFFANSCFELTEKQLWEIKHPQSQKVKCMEDNKNTPWVESMAQVGEVAFFLQLK